MLQISRRAAQIAPSATLAIDARAKALKAEGKNPFILDSKPATADYKEFISNETRYNRLKLAFPERAEMLFDKAAKHAADQYEHLVKLQKLYGEE